MRPIRFLIKTGRRVHRANWLVRASAAALLFAWLPPILSQEVAMTSMQRGYIGVMLNDIKDDVKHYYYDPKFHGVDLDAQFKQAGEYLKTAVTFNQGMGIVAWTLRPLSDSHTFLIPPRRPVKVTYSYELQMIGGNCFATAVEPEGDAEKAGLQVGMKILSVDAMAIGSMRFWEINYISRILRPQPTDLLEVQSSGQASRTIGIPPRVTPVPRHMFLGEVYWDNVRHAQTRRRKLNPRSRTFGEGVIVWKMPVFLADERLIDDMLNQSGKYKAMIFDLRQNGGGAELALMRLLGGLFDHDVKVGERVTRKGTDALVAKPHGSPYKGRVFVLVDQRSASASEIFARVLQLTHRGLVIGDMTSGSVMEAKIYAHPFGRSNEDYFATEISQADLRMEDGISLEGIGVTPDQKMLPNQKDLEEQRDPVLAYAVSLAGAPVTPEETAKLFPIEWETD
jgi:C-terminal processing protease CtpA/Prc